MKAFFLLLFTIIVGNLVVAGQMTSSSVKITTVYSQNEKFYLKTIPYDNIAPTLRGKTYVYQTDNPKPLYEFERGFDFLDYLNSFLFLSNDGETIFSVIGFDADEEKEGLKSITIYKKGEIKRSYTLSEITGCDLEKERCRLVYYTDELSDEEKKSNKQESFLADFAVFQSDGIVYLTDSKKRTHLLDLESGNIIKSESFDKLFEELQNKARKTKYVEKAFEAPIFLDFPKLRDGRDTYQSLGIYIGAKSAQDIAGGENPYKTYSFTISGYILRDGSIEVEKLEADEWFPKEKILEFFKKVKISRKGIPNQFEKWYFDEEYFYYRNKNDLIARDERRKQDIKERESLKQRLVAEKINKIYIPKDLGDCFAELDKQLSEVDKNEMKALPKRDDMIKYHMGLGMWMRNNWGLWGGSRLQKYFTDRKIGHPDDMSSVVLFFYHDWLNGKKETWKEWEKNPKSVEILYQIK